MISTITLSQRPTLLSTTLRTQATSLLVWKQRSTKDLESFLETYDALVPGGKRELPALYEYATSRPYGFLFVDLLRPAEDMRYAKVDQKLSIDHGQ